MYAGADLPERQAKIGVPINDLGYRSRNAGNAFRYQILPGAMTPGWATWTSTDRRHSGTAHMVILARSQRFGSHGAGGVAIIRIAAALGHR